VGFVDAVKTCLRKYATFSGTASRPEYWWFVLFNFLGSLVFSFTGVLALRGLWSLVMLLPGLAVAVRRLHDTSRSAWWLLTAFIAPWLIILLCLPTKVAGNPYFTGDPNAALGAMVTEADLKTISAYCATCGKLRLPGQEFCAGCGTRFSNG
jgi:hypothetical protein